MLLLKGFDFKVINKLSGHKLVKIILGKKFNKQKKLAIKNYIKCEAHRELLLKGLEKWN